MLSLSGYIKVFSFYADSVNTSKGVSMYSFNFSKIGNDSINSIDGSASSLKKSDLESDEEYYNIFECLNDKEEYTSDNFTLTDVKSKIEEKTGFDKNVIANIKSNSEITFGDGSTVNVNDYMNNLLSQNVGFETQEEYYEFILDKFTSHFNEMKEAYEEQEQSNGFFSKLYDGAKKLLGIGTSSKDVENSIGKYEQMVQGLTDAINGKSEMNFEQAYEYYTGISFSTEQIDEYLETANIYSAVMVGCQYDENYLENFEKATGKSVNEIVENYAQCRLDTFGNASEVKNIIDEYSHDQQTYSDKLSSIVSTAGMACTVIGAITSFFCPPAGMALLSAGKGIAISGMFIDNAIDLVDNVTDSDGLTKDEIKDLALETGVEVVSYSVGRGIGKLTNGLNSVVSSKFAEAGANNITSYIAGQSVETVVDTGLSLAADYAIAQGQSFITTGEFMDSEDYWSLDRFLGEGKNQLIGILTGLSSAKVSAYQQGVIKTAQGMLLAGDTDGAKNYLQQSGIKMNDTSFEGFVKNVQEVDTMMKLQTSRVDKAGETEIDPATKFADTKIKNVEINQQLSLNAVALNKTYEEHIKEVKAETKQRFSGLESVEDKNITARAKGDESTFNKLAAKFLKGKLPSTSIEACSDVIGDAYGTRIQMNSVDPDVAKVKITETLDGTGISYEQFVAYITKQGTFDSDITQKIEEIKIPVLDSVKEIQSQGVVNRLVELINNANENEPPIITELNNYGSNISSYFTDAQLEKIATVYETKYGKKLDVVTKLDTSKLSECECNISTDGKNTITVENDHAKYTNKGAQKDSGYTSSQMNTKHQLSDGSVGNGELQIRGTEVNAFADVEHIPYDIRQNKIKEDDSKYSSIYKLIKDEMDDSTYNAYNNYLTAVYESLRLTELGISCDEPKIETFLGDKRISDYDMKLLSRAGLKKLHG